MDWAVGSPLVFQVDEPNLKVGPWLARREQRGKGNPVQSKCLQVPLRVSPTS